MRLRFLGTGAAFTADPANYQSNMILETDPDSSGRVKRLLIDCGGDARRSLAALGLSQCDIDAVYVSHLHADHIGGMEWLGFTTYFNDKLPKPTLYLPEPLEKPLWEESLKAGMALVDYGVGCLNDFFAVNALPETGQFSWGPATVTLMPTLHLLAEDGSEMLSYGLMIQGPNRLAYLTTDTRPNEEVMLPRYTQADLVFQDCETASTASGAHSHYTELAKLPAAAKAKMWLYHYQDGAKPDCLEDGFLGWVQPGQGFEL